LVILTSNRFPKNSKIIVQNILIFAILEKKKKENHKLISTNKKGILASRPLPEVT
jgi:hypothetical protein